MSKNSSKQNLTQLIEWLASNKNVKKVVKTSSGIKMGEQLHKKRR